MSTSASASAGKKASLPETDAVNGWDTDELVDFLHKQDLKLSDSHFQVFYQEEINGLAFLKMDEQSFRSCGFKVGPTTILVDIANKLKGRQEGKYHDCVLYHQPILLYPQ
jgi:hypothetical protein